MIMGVIILAHKGVTKEFQLIDGLEISVLSYVLNNGNDAL